MSMHCANATPCILLVVRLALNIFYFFCFKKLSNYSAPNEYRKREENEQCQMLNLQ
jgi:hypothetical protein